MHLFALWPLPLFSVPYLWKAEKRMVHRDGQWLLTEYVSKARDSVCNLWGKRECSVIIRTAKPKQYPSQLYPCQHALSGFKTRILERVQGSFITENLKDSCISRKVRLEIQRWPLDVSEATGKAQSWKWRGKGSWEQRTSCCGVDKSQAGVLP